MKHETSLPSLGIDIAKAKFDALLLHEGKARSKAFPNSEAGFAQLRAWLAQQDVAQAHVCMEATCSYWQALAEDLHVAGHPVSVMNPAQIRAFADSELSRNKTDASDAAVIARFCRTQAPATWTPPTPQARELQELTHHLDGLKKARLQHGNRLHAASNAEIRRSLERSLAHFDAEIRQAEEAIERLFARSASLKAQRDLLTTIPGFGALTATIVLAEVPMIDRFESARQLAAYAGVTPMQRRSGSSVRGKTHMSKRGNSRLRRALYMPAVSAVRNNPVIKAHHERLLKRGKPPMVGVGAAMRKLLHQAYGVLKSGKPFDPKIAAAA